MSGSVSRLFLFPEHVFLIVDIIASGFGTLKAITFNCSSLKGFPVPEGNR
jgi:hypothetical protein